MLMTNGGKHMTGHEPMRRGSAEKKKHIYETAMRMFEQNGYEQTSIRDICREAKITNSTFYHFFGDKLAILLQFYYIMLEDYAGYLAHTEENLRAPYQAICDFFAASSSALAQYGIELARQIILNMHRMLSGGYPALPAMSMAEQLSDFLEKAKRYGTVAPEADCRADAEYLILGANGVMFYWLSIANTERYDDLAARMLPRIFSAVTDAPVCVRFSHKECGA